MENINNNHNVYILGAGFSSDAGMPLVSNFITKMREAAVWLEENNRTPEFKSIEKVFNFRKNIASAAYRIKVNIDNIESLFSLASAIDQTGLQDSMINAITATIDYCEKTAISKKIDVMMSNKFSKFLGISNNSSLTSIIDPNTNQSIDLFNNQMDLFDYYACILSGQTYVQGKQDNSIITFNYDIELEKSFNKLKIPFDYNLKHVQYDNYQNINYTNPSIPLYKLHGSINWAYPGTKGKRLTIYQSYLDAFTKGKSRLLIPPTWQKVFSGHMISVWQRAIESLSTATRIIIFGFSIPETDIHFKYLLAAGLNNNISLQEVYFINKEPENTMKFKIENLFQHEFIENQNIKYIEKNIQHSLQDENFLKKINRYNNEFK